KNPAKPASKLEEGDRIKYVGPNDTFIKMSKRSILSKGQRREVREIKDEKLAIIFYASGESDGKSSEPPVHWLALHTVCLMLEEIFFPKHEFLQSTSNMIQMLKLVIVILLWMCFVKLSPPYWQVLESHPSIIVYFPDHFSWLPERYYWSFWKAREKFFGKVKKMFNQLTERKVLIYGQNKSVPRSEELECI
ncbi:P-loop containing nucleoside triphosphatehydrolases superfamily protein, partial [Striga asiatica]